MEGGGVHSKVLFLAGTPLAVDGCWERESVLQKGNHCYAACAPVDSPTLRHTLAVCRGRQLFIENITCSWEGIVVGRHTLEYEGKFNNVLFQNIIKF